MNNIEHDNGRMMKEMSHLTKQFQRLKSSYDNLLDKNKQLEKRSDEQETIIEHMREIVFNDTSEDSRWVNPALIESFDWQRKKWSSLSWVTWTLYLYSTD